MAEQPPPAEPWYYRFLAVMTHVFLWGNVSGVALASLGWVGWLLFVVAGSRSPTRPPGARPGDVAVDAGPVLLFLTASAPYLVGLLVWLLVALMAAGWSFLALDAARNLRALRYSARGGD
jgi:hypothetical protein